MLSSFFILWFLWEAEEKKPRSHIPKVKDSVLPDKAWASALVPLKDSLPCLLNPKASQKISPLLAHPVLQAGHS